MQARITSSGKPWAPLLSAFPDAVWHVPIQEAADYAANDTAVHAHWPGVHAWPWEALRIEHVERCLVLAPDDVVGYLRMGDYLTGEDAANIVIGHMAGAAVAGIGPGNGPTVGPDLLVIDTAKIRPEVLPRPDTWPPRLQSRYLSAAVLELGQVLDYGRGMVSYPIRKRAHTPMVPVRCGVGVLERAVPA